VEEDNTDKWLKAKGSVFRDDMTQARLPRDSSTRVSSSSHRLASGGWLGERIRNRELYGHRETRVYRTGPYRGHKNYMGWMLDQTKLDRKAVRS